jgi:hypothetical protein
VAAVPSGLSPTPLITKKNLLKSDGLLCTADEARSHGILYTHCFCSILYLFSPLLNSSKANNAIQFSSFLCWCLLSSPKDDYKLSMSIIIQFNSIQFLCLFTCLYNSPKVRYTRKISRTKYGRNIRALACTHTHTHTHTHTQRLKTKQGNLCHLVNNKNSVSTIAPTIIQCENKYMYLHWYRVQLVF